MRLTVNAVDYNVEIHGAGAPLLCLHGFTGCAANWRMLGEALAPRFQVIAVDLLGHGDTEAPADPARYRMERTVADLAGLLDELALTRVDLLGYSMGGRVALHCAAAHPGRVRGLILESASPGLASAVERQARRQADEALAERIARDGLEAFIEQWERLPLFASQENLPAEARAALRAQRLRNNPIGLANSLRGLGTGVQPPLWEQLPEVKTRTLLIAGALDLKFAEVARQMAAALPNAQLEIVPAAGHTVHLEQPAAFVQAVTRLLETLASNYTN